MADESGLKSFTGKAALVIVLAVVVLVGMVFTAQFSKQLRTTTTQINVSTDLIANTTAALGTAGQYPYLQTASPCYNNSAGREVLSTGYYSVDEGSTDGGGIVLSSTDGDVNLAWNGTSVNCTITYLADSTNQGHADKFTAGLAIFGTFIAILILGLVGKVVIGLFTKKN